MEECLDVRGVKLLCELTPAQSGEALSCAGAQVIVAARRLSLKTPR